MPPIFLNPGARAEDKHALGAVPPLKLVQAHRLRLPVLRECLTCHSVAFRRHGYSPGPELENLDQEEKKQMHCQPSAILVSAVAACLQNEDTAPLLSEAPTTGWKTGPL